MKAELDLSIYTTKVGLIGETVVPTYNLAAKSDLYYLKDEVDKIYLDKLKPVPAHLNKLSQVVDNDFIKKSVHDKLDTNFNAMVTSEFVFKS